MAKVHQVIKYVKLHFDRGWKSEILPHAVMKYTSVDRDSGLIVVAEGDAGLWSYYFPVGEKQEVYVIGDLVHIPCPYKEKQNANIF